jgi:hypothetical protein
VFLLVIPLRTFAQDEFYNRDSSGYTYRIGPVLPKIQQDWQLGTLGRDFTFGFNPSGVNIVVGLSTLARAGTQVVR